MILGGFVPIDNQNDHMLAAGVAVISCHATSD